MTAQDAEAVEALAMRTLLRPPPGVEEAVRRERVLARLRGLLATDPGGALVAERRGRIVGVAMALVRGRVWGLSLFAVDDAARGAGIGRRLLEAALAYGRARGADAWMVLSSEHPAAMRLYARRGGLEAQPALAAVGVPRLDDAPGGATRVEEAGDAGIPVADAIGRAVRGAGHGPDLPGALREQGHRLLLYEERAFALAREGVVALVAGRDEEAAAAALWGALLSAPRGSTAVVTFMTAANQWAIRACLDAGLPLSPDGPVMTRGRLGPLRPYLPSGAWL